MDNEKGIWRTIRGRRIFIASGESLGQAMAKSGKFKREDIREGKHQARLDTALDKNKYASESKRHKIAEKYHKKQAKDEEYSYRYKHNANNQAEKNKIHEDRDEYLPGKTRVERNYPKYSKTDRREVEHEELQKKLAEYKAKKQSNNKIQNNNDEFDMRKYTIELQHDKGTKKIDTVASSKESAIKSVLKSENAPDSAVKSVKDNGSILNKQSNNKVETEKELYERAKNNPESIDPMTENSTDWEALEKKYGKQETIKNYVEKKKSNNAQTTNRILERSGKVNQKTLKSYADDGLATDITRYSEDDIKKLEKKHGRLTSIKTSMGTYGMNGMLLKSEKTGEYFVITARNTNIFRF